MKRPRLSRNRVDEAVNLEEFLYELDTTEYPLFSAEYAALIKQRLEVPPNIYPSEGFFSRSLAYARHTGCGVLDTALSQYPELRFLLRHKLIELLAIDVATKPFTTDKEYLAYQEHSIFLRMLFLDTNTLLSEAVLGDNGSHDPTTEEELVSWCNRTAEIASQLLILHREVSRICAERLRLSTRQPRLLRLMDKYQLQNVERDIFTLHLICACSEFIPLELSSTRSVRLFFDLQVDEVLHFYEARRLHVMDMLLIRRPARILDSEIGFNDSAAIALYGGTLTEEQAYKISKTALLDILREDEPAVYGAFVGIAPPPPLRLKQSVAEVISMPSSTNTSSSDVSTFDISQNKDSTPPLPPTAARLARLLRRNAPTDSTNTSPFIAPREQILSIIRQDILGASTMPENRQKPQPNDTPTPSDILPEHPGSKEKRRNRTGPYPPNGMDYLADQFERIEILLSIWKRRKKLHRYGIGYSSVPVLPYMPTEEADKIMRDLVDRKQKVEARIATRLRATPSADMPRVEALAATLCLSEFEKLVLLATIGRTLAPELWLYANHCFPIKALLESFCDSFAEQIRCRRAFYATAPLVREGILRIDCDPSLLLKPEQRATELVDTIIADLSRCFVDIDKRMAEFLLGIEYEIGAVVEGSHLYFPEHADIDRVVLPADQKKLIVDTVKSHAVLLEKQRALIEGTSLSSESADNTSAAPLSSGIVLLFHGKSGTGKTMMANALANMLNKKLLLINFPNLEDNPEQLRGDQVLRMLFREAKINDAVVVFDECDGLFSRRPAAASTPGPTNPMVGTMLTELERFDGLVVMTTNRPYDLDEAMHRRVTMATEFRPPDVAMRRKIWEVLLPPAMRLAVDVDLNALAVRFELSGGLIKNAIICALGRAVARVCTAAHAGTASVTPEAVIVTQDDLVFGSKTQLRGQLRHTVSTTGPLEHHIAPSGGLDALVLSPKLASALEDIVTSEKARAMLFTEWGFGESAIDQLTQRDRGVVALFYSHVAGTGKLAAAEAIAWELGRPVKLVNAAQVLSKFVGDTAKRLEALFEDAAASDSVLVFKDAEGLFGCRVRGHSAVDRYANVETGVLLHHLERHAGVVVLTTNWKDAIDPAFFRRFRFVVKFSLPRKDARERLWKHFLPVKTPVDRSVNIAALAERFVGFSPAVIKSAVFKAASRAALRAALPRVTQADLMTAGEEEEAKIPSEILRKARDKEQGTGLYG